MDTPWSDPGVLGVLSKRRLGKRLARQLAAALLRRADDGGLYFSHRDYCGHGLIYVDGSYRLFALWDGVPDARSPIAQWPDEDAFVAFFSEQSDYSMSGADPTTSVFFTEDRFTLNNQRLTRHRIDEFVRGRSVLYASTVRTRC